jgi:hypothetical protein
MSPQYFALQVSLIVIALFVGMLVCQEFGRRLGMRHRRVEPEHDKGVGAAEGAVFGILGLFLAFTFSGAGERFDERRHQIVDEANAIENAWLRVDVLPQADRAPLRGLIRDYLDTRIGIYKSIPDMKKVEAGRAHAHELQRQIWNGAVAAAESSHATPAYMVLLPALNDMFEISTKRISATRIHPPFGVFAILAILALVGAVFSGYGQAGQKKRPWLHALGFATVMTAAIFITLDLEYPRFGFLRIDQMDEVMVELRHTMD